MAHALYGITMEEPGISRLISVKLREEANQGHRLEETTVNA